MVAETRDRMLVTLPGELAGGKSGHDRPGNQCYPA